MPTATVTGVDVYSWQEPIEGTIPTQFSHLTAKRGDVITVTAKELERGVDLAALTAGTVDVNAVGDPDAVDGPLGDDLTDEEIAELDAPQLVAWLGQHPDEAERVADLEEQRARPRKTVLTAAGR